MSHSITILEEVQVNNQTIQGQHTHSGGYRQSLSESIPDESTDLEVVFPLDVSAIKAIFIKSDQDITIETNDGSSPDDTLTLTADCPYIWHENSEYTNLLTADVTSLFVTNASGAAATLEIEAIVDATP